MINRESVAKASIIAALIMIASGCVVAPREGYYDRDHHRYYREHTWHECHDRDDYCR
jgi:hypothetical protein